MGGGRGRGVVHMRLHIKFSVFRLKNKKIKFLTMLSDISRKLSLIILIHENITETVYKHGNRVKKLMVIFCILR